MTNWSVKQIETKSGGPKQWGVYNRAGNCVAVTDNRKYANLFAAAPRMQRLIERLRGHMRGAGFAEDRGGMPVPPEEELCDITINAAVIDETDAVIALAKAT